MSSTGDNKFNKIKKWIAGTGMPSKLSPAYEHSMDKSPDMTVVRTPQQKMLRKVVKI